MSEYQYYEFQAVDRPLTSEQMSELRSVSSRGRIAPTSYVNEYHWGDFKGSPHRWMERYFDAFLYLTNWGTRWLMFAVPANLLDPETVAPYCGEDGLSCRIKDERIILSFCASEVEEVGWIEDVYRLSSMISLRSDLIYGDFHCLYLGWLLGVQRGEFDDSEIEPPVPPGLKQLNGQLQEFAGFLDIDHDLISTAAENSPRRAVQDLSKSDIEKWLSTLSVEEKDAAIIGLLEQGGPHVVAEFRKRAIDSVTQNNKDTRTAERRTVGELVARARFVAEERRRREAEKCAREQTLREQKEAEERKKYIESLVGKEDKLWADVNSLIAVRQARQYDQAVSLLKDLREVADINGTSSKFALRIDDLRHTHFRKTSLMSRLQEAKLFDRQC
jgi:hypothetical protein